MAETVFLRYTRSGVKIQGVMLAAACCDGSNMVSGKRAAVMTSGRQPLMPVTVQ